jgi:hypothetical protein
MDGYLFYYSGSKTGEKKYGVGIAIAKRLNMEWNRITYLIE